MENRNVLAYVPAEELERELESNIDMNNWNETLKESTVNKPRNNDEYEVQSEDENIAVHPTTQTNVKKIETRDVVMTIGDKSAILALLKSDVNANKNGKWNEKSLDDVGDILSSEKSLQELLDVDLRIILCYLRTKGHVKTKDYVPKHRKIKDICQVLSIHTNNTENTNNAKIRKKIIPSLKDLSLRTLNSKVPKHCLNIIFAEYLWPEELKTWQSSSPLKNGVNVSGITSYPDLWFYQPEYSSMRNQLEVRCIDSSHLLTRTRRATCKGGIEGGSKKAWADVAYSKRKFLTPVMVDDVVDPMSVPMAITHFSKDVEREMICNGDYATASLVRDVRNWWKSEDEPGIPALQRILLRSNLRSRLLSYFQFENFPPPTMYVNGWPLQLWEGLMANIDAKSILYSLSQTGTYNPRAFSSMMGETFFSELTNQDRQGHGTVTVDEFSRFIGTYIEQMHVRLDPKRTSDTTVYKIVGNDEQDEISGENMVDVSTQNDGKCIKEINPRDHFFDSSARCRTSKKLHGSTVSTDKNAVQKGSLGVRWQKARLDESKLLPTKKMGLKDEDY